LSAGAIYRLYYRVRDDFRGDHERHTRSTSYESLLAEHRTQRAIDKADNDSLRERLRIAENQIIELQTELLALRAKLRAISGSD